MNEKKNMQPLFKSEAGKKAVFDFYDKLLMDWDFPYESKFVETRFGKTHVISVGEDEKPPLFLLHGSGSNLTMWLADMKPLSNDFKVYAVDIIGQPGKSEEVRPTLESDGYADWLFDVVHAFSYESASFVGNSLGGWLSLKFATAYPKMADKLVLIATSGVSEVRLSSTFRMLYHFMRGDKGMLRLQQLINGKDDIPQVAIDYSKLMMDHFSPITDRLPLFSDEQLNTLSMPVLFIGGEHDFFLHSQKTAERLEALLPDVETIVIPNNGHVIFDATKMVIPFLLR